MLNKIFISTLSILFFALSSCKKVVPPAPFGAVPSEKQMKWQEIEYYAFIHFSMNTFTDIEWGYGDKDPVLFDPTELDCRQWARICKEAGMKGIILTAKHHDGFCLWPSEYTEYSVKKSPWRDGKGDLVRELSDACKEYGLKLGIYLSPWDRNHAEYGRPEYITYYRNQLKELLTNYGEIFEVWLDGANGGDGYYGGANDVRNVDRKTYYDWGNTHKLIYELQPGAMIFSDAGPDVRWCGNEEGWVGKTNWSTLRRDEMWPGYPHYKELRTGHEDAAYWVPAEVDVSIRPGWFYHQYEDHKVKTLPQLLDIYYHSIGRNGSLLINFPVDKRGLIHETDEKQILKLAGALKADFAHNLAKNAKVKASNVRGNASTFSVKNVIDKSNESYWTTDDEITSASLTIDLGEPTDFNRFLVQEYIRLGQRIKAFTLEALIDDEWKELAKETTIGYKRILRLPTVKATKVRFTITDAKSCPIISNIELYNAPKVLMSPAIRRNKDGEITIESADTETTIHYTLDGSTPDKSSTAYSTPFTKDTKVNIKAVVYDAVSGKSSPVSHEQFDISRKNWKIPGEPDEKANVIFDGDPATSWHQQNGKIPVDLVVDLGQEYKVNGFKYLPDQSRFAKGIIFNYRFFVSPDNKVWKEMSEGEFSNIKNNPLWQTKNFEPVKARYVKLRAMRNTDDNDIAGYAEFDISTE